MTKSVNLYLASGVSEGVGFWVVNFTEEDNILNSLSSKLLECYRKELFGLEGAIEVKEAINTCLLYTSPSPRDATLSRMPSSA